MQGELLMNYMCFSSQPIGAQSTTMFKEEEERFEMEQFSVLV